MDYLYSTATGTDGFQSPYTRENTEGETPRDSRRAKPAPHLSFANRPLWQKFEYDWLGNLSETDDDAHGFYDRSIGTQSHANSGKPYQLSSATNSTQAVGGPAGNVTTNYDVTGNLRRMAVARTTNTARPCLPTGSGCNQYYAYDYDEVGRLVRARRWDAAAAFPAASDTYLPSGDAQIELRYRYDSSDQRVIKRVYKGVEADQRHTLYVFGSLEVRRTAFEGDAYTISNESLVPYAMANGVRLARLHYSGASTSPQVAGTGLGEQAYRTNTAATLHVLLELGDHLGSTGTVLDKLTSELVEKTTYLPFGARENDYRGTDGAGGSNRWSSFREDYGFTGKEEDVEVGLTYFGKRFLSPQLGRWVTADPLAVHAPGKADLNVYVYVNGRTLMMVDLHGLDKSLIQTFVQEFAEGYKSGAIAAWSGMHPEVPGQLDEGVKQLQTNESSTTRAAARALGVAFTVYAEHMAEYRGVQIAMKGKATATGLIVGDSEPSTRVQTKARAETASGPQRTAAAPASEGVKDARNAVAREYYRAAGFSPEETEAHLKGVESSDPVEVVSIRAGDLFVQYQAQGAPNGRYLAGIGTRQEELGINVKADPTRVPRILEATRDATALKSTARDTSQDQSIDARFRGTGGGTQYFTPDPGAFQCVEPPK